MITRNMMAGGSGALAVFEFKYTVTTNASSSSDKKAALPVNLYGQTGVEISVDWGDGNTSVLKPSDYTASSSLASVHEYASVGTYQITASSSNWSNAYLLSCYADATISSANNANQPVYWWRRTLKSVDSPLPPVKGVLRLASASATTMTASDNDLGFLFHRCEKMTSIPANLFENAGHIEEFNSTFYNCVVLPSIPAGLFDPCISALNFSDCFRYCTALTSIPVSLFKYCTAATNMYNVFRFCNKVTSVPADLFKYNTLVTNMGGAFNKCDALKNFTLCIGSPNVATVTDFIPNASSVTRIVCVPADSTTYASFNAYKNTSNNVTVSTSNTDCGIEEEGGDEYWQFSVNTQAGAAGEKKTGIPFNLYNRSGMELTVDWGDNTTSTLTPLDYSDNESNSLASVHEYTTPNEYTIKIYCNNWQNAYIHYHQQDVTESSNPALYWFRRTLKTIDNKLPLIKGINSIVGYGNYTNRLRHCFRGCSSLTSIPSGLFDNNTEVTDFYGCFQNCSSLTSIPSGLFDNNTEVTTFYRCFENCTSLTSIPTGLFDNNIAVKNFDECFDGCSFLASIPSGLFDNNTAAETFIGCFADCTSLASIPSGLFVKNTAVTSFSFCFNNCTNLLYFHLKIGSSSVNTINNFISNASNVDRILCVPANSTTYTKASSYANSSNNIIVSTDIIDCSEAWEFTIDTEATTAGKKKTGIPFNLYGQTRIKLLVDWGDGTTSTLTSSDYATADDCQASRHEYTTAGEYTITVVSNDWENTYLFVYPYPPYLQNEHPLDLFRSTLISVDTVLPAIKGVSGKVLDDSGDSISISASNSFSNFFLKCSKLQSIPSGLFDNNTGVTTFYRCFEECSSLASIPSGLFDKNTAVTTFAWCFWACSSLASIPSGLFDKNTAVTTFNSCFDGCSTIQSIPSGLFDKNTVVTDFGSCFRVCTSLASIPSGLFDKNTEATNFSACFVRSVIQSIPSGLFDKNTKATDFSNCFTLCASLTSIPSGLFDKNTEATNFLWCFQGCSSIASIPSGLFDKNTKATDFSSCFANCSSIASIPSGLFDKNTKATDFVSCFNGCSSLQSIPSGLFDKNTVAISFSSCFANCSSLASVSRKLFKNNTAVTSFSGCFNDCSSLLNFHLVIGSSNVASFANFISNASNVERVLCVPANSTTYTTASSYANSSNNIIVSTDIINCAETWEFTIDTEATTSGERLGAIPFNLTPYGGGGTAPTLLVDWGDGTATTLTKNDYTSQNSTASIHEYSNPGEYTITVQSSDWANTYILTYQSPIWTPTDINRAVYIWRNTLTQLNNILPEFAGVNHNSTGNNLLFELDDQVLFLFYGCSHLEAIPSGLFNNNTAITNFKNCLAGCSSITSIPSDLFDKHTSATYMYGVFSGCSSITSIPSGLFDKNTLVYSFENCFYGCSSLASIPAGLFDKNTAVNYFGSCFSGCSSITSIPAGLFDKNTAVESFSSCFYGCSSLASIPSGLFDKNTAVEEFGSCFGNCDVLTTIPAGLFDKNTAVDNFYGCFAWCDALTTIPAGLFEKNTAVESFYNCFAGCRALANVPSNLFEKNTAATRFDQCFQYCSALLNFHLKIGSSSVTTFSNFIPSASNVDRILCVPANSTTYTTVSSYANSSNNIIVSTDVIDCAETWEFTIDTEATESGEKKTGIPFNLYGQTGIQLIVDWGDNTTSTLTSSDYTTSSSLSSIHEYATAGEYAVTIACNDWNNLIAMTFEYTNPDSNVLLPLSYFRNTLKSIDSKLPELKGINAVYTHTSSYPGETKIGSAAALFYNCRKLTSVPSDMFTQCTTVTSFYKCFYNCTSLQSIPSGLFDNNTKVTTFYNCFRNCTSLQSIPSGLFDKNTAVTDFYGCFYSCTSLQSIPSGLFDKNTAVTSFYYCFYGCSSLQSIPEGLFNSNTAVTNFSSCFSGCSSLQSIPTGLFDKNTAVTNFSGCFNNCTSLQSIPSGLFDNNTAVTGFNSCFSGCSSLQSIPTGLFDKNTAVTNFLQCFQNCTFVQSIPSGLFDKNTAVTTFGSCFNGCSSLQSIPSGLFDKNTAVTNFISCFNDCSSLQSIPSGLFDKNTAVTNFTYCFYNCTLLADFTLNIGSSLVTSTSSFVTLKSDTTRTINVPANSATYTAFSNVASSLGLTIVGV